MYQVLYLYSSCCTRYCTETVPVQFHLYQAELERQLSVTAQLQGEVGDSLALLDSLGEQYEEVHTLFST